MPGWGGWGCAALLWVLGAVAGGSAGYRRKVSLEYNPGFNSSTVDLLHVRAVGRNDTIHYVWSTIGAPTALLMYTGSRSSSLHVDWTKLLSPSPSGAIRIEPPGSVLYSKAVVFAKVFEFNGTNTSDLAEVPASAFYATYDLANFRWDSLAGNLNKTARTATFRGVSLDAAGSFSNGSISFQVTAFEDGGRDSPLPRLLHTANSSKVEFAIRGVAPRGNHSRFVLEIFTVEEAGRQQTLESLRSIDDEYTPTIFEIAQLVPRPANGSVGSGFLQWKTVAYSAWEAKREDSVHCRYYPLQAENRTLPGAGIAHAYFEAGPLERGQGVAAINVSFGGDNREPYEEKHYLSWSALIGFGEPPRESFSPAVIAIVAAALGTPVVLLICGTIAAFAVRKRQQAEFKKTLQRPSIMMLRRGTLN